MSEIRMSRMRNNNFVCKILIYSKRSVLSRLPKIEKLLKANAGNKSKSWKVMQLVNTKLTEIEKTQLYRVTADQREMLDNIVGHILTATGDAEEEGDERIILKNK